MFSSQGRVSVSSPFLRSFVYALKGCEKEDESDVTFTAFCPSTLLSWSSSPLESSGSAARQGNFFVLYKRTFSFVFDWYVSNKRTLYLYFIVTLVISEFSIFLNDCYVRDKHKPYLFLIVTLVISALSLLYLIVMLQISEHCICTL